MVVEATILGLKRNNIAGIIVVGVEGRIEEAVVVRTTVAAASAVVVSSNLTTMTTMLALMLLPYLTIYPCCLLWDQHRGVLCAP